MFSPHWSWISKNNPVLNCTALSVISYIFYTLNIHVIVFIIFLTLLILYLYLCFLNIELNQILTLMKVTLRS